MRFRLWGLVILAAVPLLLLAVAGCDDDDDDDNGGDGDTPSAGTGASEELTLYFQDLAAIQEELNEGVRTIDDQTSFSDPARARQTLNAASTAGQAAFTDLQELDVPAEASDAHSSLESAGQTYLSAVDAMADDLQNIEAGAEFDAFVVAVNEPDSEYSQAKAGLQEACAEMETLAEDNNVDVAVKCPV